MSRRIVLEFSDGRRLDNLVTPISDRPEDEILADLARSVELMDSRGFKPTGVRTFQEWTPYGWVRMAESDIHAQSLRLAGGFRTQAAHLR